MATDAPKEKPFLPGNHAICLSEHRQFSFILNKGRRPSMDRPHPVAHTESTMCAATGRSRPERISA